MKRYFSIFLTCCLIMSFILPVTASTTNTDPTVSKISNTLVEEMDTLSTNDTVPVYIWAEDIDQAAVQTATEIAVGFSKESITQPLDMPENALVASVISEQAWSAAAMEAEDISAIEEYMQATAEARAEEQRKTDAFLTTQRNIAKERYITQNAKLVQELDLAEDGVLFVSQYSPLIIAEMTAKQIVDAEEQNDIVSLDLVPETMLIAEEDIATVTADETETTDSDHLDAMRAAYGIDTIHETLKLTGNGVTVGVVETGTFSTTEEELSSDRCSIIGTPNAVLHANWVSRVLAGTRGIAKDAILYSCSIDYGGYTTYAYPRNVFASIEMLLDYNVKVINCSWAIGPTEEYELLCQWLDHVAAMHSVSFVVSAGNDGGIEDHVINRAGLSSNVITVGAYDGQLTESTSDDILFSYSSYDDQGIAFKPDLVAPADYSYTGTFSGGTSTAAPFTAGTIALMLELRPSLALQPHAVKAILLASCQRKVTTVTGETMSTTGSSLTERQGAGAIDPWMTMMIVAAGNYGVREMSASAITEDIRVQQPAYGASGMTVALTWIREGYVDETAMEDYLENDDGSEQNKPSYENAVVVGEEIDMDLSIRQNNAMLIASAVEKSSTEFLYIIPSTDNDLYTFRIQKNTETNSAVRYAYAWAVTTQDFQCITSNEGVFYVNNKATGMYLTMDSTAKSLKQTAFAKQSNYQWIVQGVTDGYQMISVDTAGGYVTQGSALDDNNYSANAVSDNANTIHILSHSDGSISLTKTISDAVYALKPVGNAADDAVIWAVYSETDMTQRWYTERYCLQRGDMDNNGVFQTDDASILYAYVSGAEPTLTYLQTFLADMNGDRTLNLRDVMVLYQKVGE